MAKPLGVEIEGGVEGEIAKHDFKEEEPFDESEIIKPEVEKQNLEDVKTVSSVIERNRKSLA